MAPASSPTSILLVADSPDTCELIAAALLSAPTFYRIERVTSAELLVNEPSAGLRLALVDDELQATSQAAVVQRLTAAGIAAVALVDPQDVQALQAVVLAGAAALLARPFVDSQLWETVGTALARGARVVRADAAPGGLLPGRSQGIVVALYAPKGGSGTSVLAANLAVALQERAPRGAVLLEAGEGPGSQAVLLNLRAERTIADLLARFDPADPELLDGVLTTHASGLRVLLAPPGPGPKIGAEFLQDVIDALQAMFDFVIIDLPAAGRAGAVAVMRKAHAALVIVLPELTSLQHSRLFVEYVAGSAPDVQLNVVLNRGNLAGGVPADAIRRHLKLNTAVEIPDEPALVAASVNRGVPLVSSQPRSAIARAVQKLGRDLVPAGGERGEPAVSAAAPPAGSRLGRLAWGGRRG